MNEDKISKIIKDIRIKNNLTQKEFASIYNVTYQAVSKWENGKNIPDISILKKICNDYNISLDEFLDNNIEKKNNKYIKYIIGSIVLLLIIVILIVILNKNNSDFKLQPISASCKEYEVMGSIAYNKDTTSIYISSISYCGDNEDVVYEKLKCNLIEDDGNIKKVIDTKSISNAKLDDIKNNISFQIDNYKQLCKEYNDNSFYLEIEAINKDNTYLHRIPLKLSNDCINNELR